MRAFRRRRHPALVQLSRYLDGDLAPGDRRALERHVLDCGGCRRMLRSLAYTLRTLGSMRVPASPELAERIIRALRVADSPGAAPQAGIFGVGAGVLHSGHLWLAQGLASLRHGLRGPRLRLTVPIALLVGTILSLVNQGGMLVAGEIDLRMCAICGLNFLLPFVAFNLLLFGVARQSRSSGDI